MHDSVMEFVASVCSPLVVQGARVLEVGSYDVNGSVRPLIEPHAASYTGIDVRPGPGVDVVCDAAHADSLGTFDLVVSTEMLEHARDWRAALQGMVRATRLAGAFVLTTRGPGAGRHDHPGDYWRFTLDLIGDALERLGMQVVIESDPGAGYTDGVFASGVRGTLWESAPLADLDAEPAPR